MLIHGQNSYPAGLLKIALHSVKSQGFFFCPGGWQPWSKQYYNEMQIICDVGFTLFKYGYFHLHLITNTDIILSKQILAYHYNRTLEHWQLVHDLVYWYRYGQFVYDSL